MQGGLNTDALEYYGALDLSGTRLVLTRSGLSNEEQRTTPGVVGGEDFFESVQLDDGTWSPPVPLRHTPGWIWPTSGQGVLRFVRIHLGRYQATVVFGIQPRCAQFRGVGKPTCA